MQIRNILVIMVIVLIASSNLGNASRVKANPTGSSSTQVKTCKSNNQCENKPCTAQTTETACRGINNYNYYLSQQ